MENAIEEFDYNVKIPKRAEYSVRYARKRLTAYLRRNFKAPRKSVVKEKNSLLDLFNAAYEKSEELGLKKKEQIEYINEDMCANYRLTHFDNLIDMTETYLDFKEYIEEKMQAKLAARAMRVRRFYDKASLHCWNYFVTQTYDSSKFESEEDFKKAYLTCLSHLSTDFGWRYMGVFERGDRTGRLHFHGIFYIPTGAMKGFMRESRYYSPYERKMKKSMLNTFFAERFGRCDFERITNGTSVGAVSSYILKYVRKSENKVVYSRGIASALEIELTEEDIIYAVKKPYANKFVVFDYLLDGTFLDDRASIITS